LPGLIRSGSAIITLAVIDVSAYDYNSTVQSPLDVIGIPQEGPMAKDRSPKKETKKPKKKR
jgi:hypothetical protein